LSAATARAGGPGNDATPGSYGAAVSLDAATSALRDWIAPFLTEAGVGIAVTARASDDASKGAWLALEAAKLAARGQSGNACTALLDYRLLLDLADPLAEQRLLGEILFATTDHPLHASEEGVRQERSGTSIALSSRLTRHPSRPAAPPVRIAPRPKVTGVGRLEGVVLGPGDVPLADVTVSFGESGPSRRTDADGRFAFTALPLDGAPWRLGIQAKGRRFTVEAGKDAFCVARIPLGG
jgi:hypothetical protein